MQNKGAITLLAIALALVSLYQLSFTWKTNRVEKAAREYAQGDPVKEKVYLDSIANKEAVEKIFTENKITVVVNFAAQAGVRYSMTNPDAYMESNVIGFYNLLEACRHHEVEHFVYASSSSVYGSNKKVPYSTEDTIPTKEDTGFEASIPFGEGSLMTMEWLKTLR